jgi:hypothetical protein
MMQKCNGSRFQSRAMRLPVAFSSLDPRLNVAIQQLSMEIVG